MTADDLLLGALSSLPGPGPDPGRADAVRRRCRAELARRSATRPSAALAGDLVRRVLAPAVVAGTSAAYLAEVIRRAIGLYGF